MGALRDCRAPRSPFLPDARDGAVHLRSDHLVRGVGRCSISGRQRDPRSKPGTRAQLLPVRFARRFPCWRQQPASTARSAPRSIVDVAGVRRDRTLADAIRGQRSADPARRRRPASWRCQSIGGDRVGERRATYRGRVPTSCPVGSIHLAEGCSGRSRLCHRKPAVARGGLDRILGQITAPSTWQFSGAKVHLRRWDRSDRSTDHPCVRPSHVGPHLWNLFGSHQHRGRLRWPRH